MKAAALIALALAACDEGIPPRPAGVAAWCTTYKGDGPAEMQCAPTLPRCLRAVTKYALVGVPCQHLDRVWCYGGHGEWPIFCQPSKSECEDDLAYEQATFDRELRPPCAPFPA